MAMACYNFHFILCAWPFPDSSDNVEGQTSPVIIQGTQWMPNETLEESVCARGRFCAENPPRLYCKHWVQPL